MKTLIVVALFLGLSGALFFTRPTKADFETYVRTNKIKDGKPVAGKSVTDIIGEKMKTFSAGDLLKSPEDQYLDHCTYDNYWLWTTVSHDGQPAYTGMLNHWFERSGAPTPAKTS